MISQFEAGINYR